MKQFDSLSDPHSVATLKLHKEYLYPLDTPSVILGKFSQLIP